MISLGARTTNLSFRCEVEREAAVEPDDPTTAREELELELMDEGESAAGTEIGDETP